MPFPRTAKISIIVITTIALAYLGLIALGFRRYATPTAAMEPTIPKGTLIYAKLDADYKNKIQRFDIAIYKPRNAPDQLYAKRIIGLPGEEIKITKTTIEINSKPLALPSFINPQGLTATPLSIKIPADAVFIMGDNTTNSLDSRYTGPENLSNILGKVIIP